MNEIEPALRRAYALGQKYWQQADSDFARDHRKADETQAKFNQLVESMQGWLSPAEADNLRTQLAEAQGDAERLDWIIEHRAYVVSDPDCCDGYWLNYARPDGTMWTQATEHETPRAAIDAARGEKNGA